jgi:nitroreductase
MESIRHKVSMQVHEAIRLKRAVRAFSPEPLPEDVVEQILNAGCRAQSSKNAQAWRFIAVRDRPTLQALAETGANAGHLAGAALAVVILTPDPAQLWSILFDAGQAAAYMQLAAWELGVGSCIATIYEPDRARSMLGAPPDWHVHVALSFGYPEDPSQLRAPPRRGGRRPRSETVFFERWDRLE